MLRLSLAVGLILTFQSVFGQVFWTEDFASGACGNSILIAAYDSPENGLWTVFETGANGDAANVWYVSAREAGMGEGACGEDCQDNGSSNRTLHISTEVTGDVGAAYLETNFSFTDTDLRAESPTIDCTDRSDISMSFLYMTAGNPPTDLCTVEYFDGVVWTELQPLNPTALGCAPQGTWTSITINLPASADFNPDVRIGFRWRNVDDGVATDPSVAIDDIEISGIPEGVVDVFADFSSSETIICAGDCIEFFDESTGVGINSWEWLFEGADTPVSDEQNPPGICYDVPGTYSVSLTISSPDDTDELIVDGYITVEACGSPPEAAFSASETIICAGDCIDFTDESTGDGINDWVWTFDGAETAVSSDQNPAGICYETPGSYTVSLQVSNADGDDFESIDSYITVEACGAPPTADFTADPQIICEGDCIDFTDLSTGTDITDWEWTFAGADTPSSTDQDPVGICYATAGSYDVTLSVTNAEGTDEITIEDFITVEVCGGPPTADFTSDLQNICIGDCIDFSDLSTGGNLTDWEWTFEGADTPSSTDQDPAGICYSAEGSYDVTLTVTNDEGTDEITIADFIVVADCTGPTAGFDATEIVICEGDCIDFIDESIGGATEYEWTFEGADTPTSVESDPAGICYATAGQYDVTLLVSDGTLDDELTLPGFITVEVCEPDPDPELSIGASANVICLGDCVDFEDLSIVDSIDTWLWTFEGGDPNIGVEQNPVEVCYNDSGSFDVTLVVEANGEIIDSTFSNFITVVDSCGPVANFNYTPIVCLGQCYSFENTSFEGDTYFWTFEGAATPTSEEENPTDICYLNATGLFNVTLTVVNEFGSSTSITQVINVVNPTNVNAGPDQTITQGTSTVISATGGSGSGEYTWQPFELVICFDCPTTNTVSLQETTTFIVYYEESGGCVSSDTVVVNILEDVYAVGVPNSFSPNSDNVNDILYVRGNNISRVKLIIYNRYGQEVFATDSYNNPNEGWDGTMNGKPLNAGVFGYYLEASFSDPNVSRKVEKGDITLVR